MKTLMLHAATHNYQATNCSKAATRLEKCYAYTPTHTPNTHTNTHPTNTPTNTPTHKANEAYNLCSKVHFKQLQSNLNKKPQVVPATTPPLLLTPYSTLHPPSLSAPLPTYFFVACTPTNPQNFRYFSILCELQKTRWAAQKEVKEAKENQAKCSAKYSTWGRGHWGMVKSVQPSKWSRLRRLRIRFNESPASTKSAKRKAAMGNFLKLY